MLSKEQCREIIARRVAKEFAEGDVITLGIGLPTEVANYIPHNMHVIFQSENGLLGVGPHDGAAGDNPKVTNAGGNRGNDQTGRRVFRLARRFYHDPRRTRQRHRSRRPAG